MKRTLYLFTSLLVLLTACVREDVDVPQIDDVPEGYTRVTFKASAPSPTIGVSTRAVDPDGLDVNNMTLFCFNEFGLYISSEAATIVPGSKNDTGISESGEYTAVIPSHTRIIHFLANHSEGLYNETDFPGQTESMVVANMEGGSGMLVYWSRFEMDDNSNEDIHTQLSELTYTINGTTYKGVKLIRNQAKVTIGDWETDKFHVTGYRTVNIPAFGTVAPHHPTEHFHIVENWESTDDFVTLPNNQALMSDITDINTKPEDYIFESENAGDKLISVIIKGHLPEENEANDKYYRVVMQNEDGSNFMIRRNHHYNINITGALTFGQNTFEEALTAPASNNAWISIDEWVNEISNGTETLWVEQTSYVLSSDEYAGTDWTLPYRYTKNDRGDDTAPTVTWIDNNVAYSNITNNYDTQTGEGTVTLRFYPMYDGNEQQSGSLLIKHGKLQRKINIHIIRTQHFTPSWISSQVYGVSEEKVTLMFTVPETCPEALFPFTVLISVNHLDIRSESGQQLPIYIKGEEGYFGDDWEGINYKYAYTVTEPGKHRLHMRSILKHEDNDMEPVHIEADFFETITKNVIFSGHDHTHRRLFVENLHLYDSRYAEDEELYYMLVPQKKASPQVFTIDLQERQGDGTYGPYNHTTDKVRNGKDEFLIYTKSLSFYDEYFKENPGHYEGIQSLAWEGEVTMFDNDSWSTNGRVMAFRTVYNPNYSEEDVAIDTEYGLQSDGSYNIYMLTNGTNNKDVVRVSSNNAYSPHAFKTPRNSDEEYDHNYDGNEYRSVIFDVAHYRPFRFAAQARIADEDGSNERTIPAASELLSNKVHGSQEENSDAVTLSYRPGQRVDILLDITSFEGSDGRSVHPFGEVFGEEFEIYIDAPMLEVDEARLPIGWPADKLRRDPRVPGRFVYTVSRTREAERAFGYARAHNTDASTSRHDNFGRLEAGITIDQEGERKCLPFKKNSITSKGDIVISSNKEKVVYWDKTFKVRTEHITGAIYYEKEGTRHPIPHNDFVAFVRLRTGARIGVVTITEDGQFELNLRDEYQFDWQDDPIDLYYTDGDGVTYNFNYTENGSAKPVDLDLLYTLVANKEPIVLTKGN
ncbi:MAG: hypothetical protein IIX50_07745 [Bacteroidaceae bacterium]|nr:hypothetical protein [Bacteroidaceae bacterium]